MRYLVFLVCLGLAACKGNSGFVAPELPDNLKKEPYDFGGNWFPRDLAAQQTNTVDMAVPVDLLGRDLAGDHPDMTKVIDMRPAEAGENM